MKTKMKKRIVLLSVLLVIGLLMAGIGTVLGAGEVLKFSGKELSASVTTNKDGMHVVTIQEDGRVVKEFTLPESSEDYIIETSNGKIVIGKMTKEEIEKSQSEAEVEKKEFLEIAKKDSKVQEIIDGKDYKVIGIGISGAIKGESDIAVLSLEVEGKFYEITIDLNSETVKSIEEQSSGVIENCYGPDGAIDCSELPPTSRLNRVHK